MCGCLCDERHWCHRGESKHASVTMEMEGAGPAYKSTYSLLKGDGSLYILFLFLSYADLWVPAFGKPALAAA